MLERVGKIPHYSAETERPDDGGWVGVMTEPQPAQLAFLTDPAPGVFVLNIQLANDELYRFQINRDQLFILNKDTADILVKAFK